MTTINERPLLSGHDRVEWAHTDMPPESFSARRLGSVWVVSKMGVYADTDALLAKITETVRFYDSIGVLASVRLGVETVDDLVLRRMHRMR